MKGLIKMLSGFLAVCIPALLLYFYMPDSWRVAPALEKPIVLDENILTLHRDATTVMVGDCTVWLAPNDLFPYGRITRRNKELARLLTDIKNAPQKFKNCKHIVVVYGIGNLAREESLDTLDSEISSIVSACQKAFPDAAIDIIPPQSVYEIAKQGHVRSDGWHLDRTGYELFRVAHADIFSPPAE